MTSAGPKGRDGLQALNLVLKQLSGHGQVTGLRLGATDLQAAAFGGRIFSEALPVALKATRRRLRKLPTFISHSVSLHKDTVAVRPFLPEVGQQ